MPWRSSLFNAFRIGGVVPKKFRDISAIVGIAVCTAAGILAGYHALFVTDPINAALFVGLLVFMGLSLARSGEETDNGK